jgi:hypothetical protein
MEQILKVDKLKKEKAKQRNNETLGFNRDERRFKA